MQIPTAVPWRPKGACGPSSTTSSTATILKRTADSKTLMSPVSPVSYDRWQGLSSQDWQPVTTLGLALWEHPKGVEQWRQVQERTALGGCAALRDAAMSRWQACDCHVGLSSIRAHSRIFTFMSMALSFHGLIQ